MIILITGASHTGKTVHAQRLLEERGYPYLSLDHLKMGLIRSGQTSLTPSDTEALTAYLWPIVREIIKTAIENGQSLIVEGMYIPAAWRADLGEEYLSEIRCVCLVMTERYIRSHFSDIKAHACDAERREGDDAFDIERCIGENAQYLARFQSVGSDCFMIDGEYPVSLVPTIFHE